MRQFPIDDSITNWVVGARHEPLTSVAHLVTSLGDTLTLVLVVIGVFVMSWLANRIDLAALIVLGSLSGYLLMITMKLLFARDRPPIGGRLIDVGGNSFPSGHAMLSMLVYSLTAIILYRLYPKVRARAAILLWFPVLAVLVGLSRVYLGVHWASDVVFGWLFGIVWFGVCLVGHAQLVRRPAILRLAGKPVVSRSIPTNSAGSAGQDASRPS